MQTTLQITQRSLPIPEARSAGIVAITFEDFIRFTSREENRNRITYPVLHNIALQYAFKNVHASSTRLSSHVPTYHDDFHRSNVPYYLYPAAPAASLHEFNGKLVCDDEPFSPSTNVIFGWQDDLYRSPGVKERQKFNMLAFNYVSMLDPDITFITFFTSSRPFADLHFPSNIRVGKQGGKASVVVSECKFARNPGQAYFEWFLNDYDLPPAMKIGTDYTVLKVKKMEPCTLIKRVKFSRAIEHVRISVSRSFWQSINVNKAFKDATIDLPVCSHLLKPL
jgi:CRISPR type I-D-associated protein Csc1